MNDYIKDNLLYCGKCNTAKQCEVRILNLSTKIMGCACKCEQEENERRKQLELERKKQRQIAILRNNGIQDKEAISYTFENAEVDKYISISKKYCDEWDKVHKENIGLLLWGDVGNGKSFNAGCIANYLINKNVPVLMTNFSKLINELSGFLIADKNEYLENLNKYDLLIIDDLGIERQSDYAQEQVFNLIDNRYKAHKPLIITTNLSLKEMQNTNDLMKKRIYDRILEICYPVKFENTKKRELKRKERMDKMREILQDNRVHSRTYTKDEYNNMYD